MHVSVFYVMISNTAISLFNTVFYLNIYRDMLPNHKHLVNASSESSPFCRLGSKQASGLA